MCTSLELKKQCSLYLDSSNSETLKSDLAWPHHGQDGSTCVKRHSASFTITVGKNNSFMAVYWALLGLRTAHVRISNAILFKVRQSWFYHAQLQALLFEIVTNTWLHRTCEKNSQEPIDQPALVIQYYSIQIAAAKLWTNSLRFEILMTNSCNSQNTQTSSERLARYLRLSPACQKAWPKVCILYLWLGVFSVSDFEMLMIARVELFECVLQFISVAWDKVCRSSHTFKVSKNHDDIQRSDGQPLSFCSRQCIIAFNWDCCHTFSWNLAWRARL